MPEKMASTTTTTQTQSAPLEQQQHKALRLRADFASELNKQAKRTRRIVYPESKDDQRRWQLEQMTGAFRLFSKLGFADGASGHISLRGMSSHVSVQAAY